MRNVNGKNYVTPVENQGKLGVCWSFASLSQAESYLLVTKDQTFDQNTSKVFSKRQLDYASAKNGVKGHLLSTTRLLGDGGNYNTFLYPSISHVSLVDKNNFKSYNDSDYSKEALYKVRNYKNSDYEVEKTIDLSYPYFENNEDKEAYINTLKQYVKKYGGAYVGTSAPESGCSIYDEENDTYLISVDDEYSCKYSGHAMHIIGWDDDYNYSYCNNNGVYEPLTSSCKEENKKEGKGAWILKNSWGENYSYVYLAYDTIYEEVDILTELKEEKTWNYMEGNTNGSYMLYHEKYIRFYVGENKTINKIKFYPLEKGEYKVYIDDELFKTIDVEEAGINTVYLDYEYDKDDDEFSHRLEITSDYYMLDDINIFYKNANEEKSVYTENYRYVDNSYSTDYDYTFYLYSETSNIKSNEKLNFKLYDENDNDISNYISYEENIVAADNANTLMHVKSTIPQGKYYIKTLYNEKVLCTSELEITVSLEKLEGLGTKESPYLIKTESDLYKVNKNMDAYYRLESDIIIEEGEFFPIGYENNEAFTGVFDGNGYTIKAHIFSQNSYEEESTYLDIYEKYGLFSEVKVSDNHDTIIKNLNLNIDFGDSNDEPYMFGSLAGYLNANTNSSNKIIIDSISIDNDAYIISSNSSYASKFIGLLQYNKNNVSINNIFIEAGHCYSYDFLLVDVIENTDIENNPNAKVNISNIEVLKENTEGFALIGNLYGNINLENVISFNRVSDNSGGGIQIIDYNEKIENATEKSNLKNIYYYKSSNSKIFGGDDNFSITNVEQKSIFDLVNKDLYENWKDFDKNWKLETIDGVPRIPILKNKVDFNYSNFPKEVKIISGNSYFLEKDNYRDIEMESLNDKIATIHGWYIVSKSKGQTKVHVKDTWDGYDGYIDVIVTASYKITYMYPNSSSGEEILYEPDETYKFSKYEDVIPYYWKKAGYKFKEWNTKKDGTGTSYEEGQEFKNLVNEDGVLFLYPQLEPINYKIIYNSNTDKVSTSTQTFTYDISSKLNENTFTKEGYKFKEWNTKADGSGDSYSNKQEVKNLTTNDNEEITLYAIWEEEYSYIINKYIVDEDNKYIDLIDINTSIEDFKKNIKLNATYTLDIDYKIVNNMNILYTGGKTKIYNNNQLLVSYTNIIRGDVNGDGKINYLDYVSIYNHIQKVKNPDLEKKELKDVYLISSDMNNDSKVNYLDYVKVYNKIKELKGDTN